MHLPHARQALFWGVININSFNLIIFVLNTELIIRLFLSAPDLTSYTLVYGCALDFANQFFFDGRVPVNFCQ